MKFNLKKPCSNCPFRNDKPKLKGWLGAERAGSIYDSIIEGAVFPCHKTNDNESQPENGFVHQEKHQFCAGALILLEKTGDASKSNMIRMAERLRLYDKNILEMDAPVFDSRAALLAWHKRK